MKAKTNCPGFVAPLPKGLVLMLLFHVLGNSDAAPLATAFTYQGRLSDSSAPLTGRYDFVFGLHTLPSDGSAMIST